MYASVNVSQGRNMWLPMSRMPSHARGSDVALVATGREDLKTPANSRMKIIPSTNSGIAYSSIELPIDPLSSLLLPFPAAVDAQ